MRFIIEFDGPVCDTSAAHYAAHQAAAKDVGWSRLDQATFWRLTRTKGREADLLPGAREGKLTEYHAKFAELVESSELLEKASPEEAAAQHLRFLKGQGACVLVTIGRNLAARSAILERAGLRSFFADAQSLSDDPRRRPAELKALASGDRRTIVVAATDALIRSAGQAEIFTVGVPLGSCTEKRLHQAGAAIVYGDLGDLVASVQAGAADLVKAGLLPASLS